MRKSTKRNLAIIATTAVLLAGGGVAWAYWTAGGSGSGTAETGTTEELIVNQVSVISALGPGGSPQELSGTFDNPNADPVYVATVTASIESVSPVGCTADNYTLADAVMTVGDEIASGDDVGDWTGATIVFTDKPLVNQDICKNAVVTISYSID